MAIRSSQVLERDKLSRGTFFADIEAQRLYVQPAGNQDITKDKALVEASTREQILRVKGSYVIVKGIRFRYAANRAQQGAVQFSGDHITVEDCIFEYTNASGAESSRARTSSFAIAPSSTTANSASGPATPTACC